MATRAFPKATDTINEINAVIEGLDNPVHRHMLETARDHYWAEVVWDVPAIVATLAPTTPVLYRFQGGAFLGMDGLRVESREAAQAMYESTRDSGMTIGPMKELKLTFGSEGISQECLQYAVIPGGGLPGLAEQVDPDKWYLVSWYATTYSPFDAENRYMTGEFCYAANQPLTIEEVDRGVAKELIGL
ncbi:hypothetical protein [Streptomyces sp. bgisy027]|uniref:hypothetical protein n=1 Tax=Streptomyces sp. bgisy027 TaxID=3413770 RepID=UPI003D73FA0F